MTDQEHFCDTHCTWRDHHPDCELAQPEQEPVAWQFYQDGQWHYGTYLHNHRKNTEADGYPVRDLYTAPPSKPEQEPTLTEKDGSPCPEFWDWLPKAYNFEGLGEFTKYNMEVAFLAGKNTALAQPEQEPVAWMWHTPDGNDVLMYRNAGIEDSSTPLYTAPPKREWVGLTDEDWHNLPTSNKQGCERDAEIFNWIEDKLKEKNT